MQFEWSDGPETLTMQVLLTAEPDRVHFTLIDPSVGRATMGGSIPCNEALEIASALIAGVQAKRGKDDYDIVREAESYLLPH